MAITREDILTTLLQSPDGMELQVLLKTLNGTTEQISPILSALARAGKVENPRAWCMES